MVKTGFLKWRHSATMPRNLESFKNLRKTYLHCGFCQKNNNWANVLNGINFLKDCLQMDTNFKPCQDVPISEYLTWLFPVLDILSPKIFTWVIPSLSSRLYLNITLVRYTLTIICKTVTPALARYSPFCFFM